MIDLLFLLYKGIYEMIILICMVKGDSMKKYIAFLRGIVGFINKNTYFFHTVSVTKKWCGTPTPYRWTRVLRPALVVLCTTFVQLI